MRRGAKRSICFENGGGAEEGKGWGKGAGVMDAPEREQGMGIATAPDVFTRAF